MAIKKSVLPPSVETLGEVLRVVQSAPEPLTAKDLSAMLATPHELSEKQLEPILQQFVDSKELFPIPPTAAKKKPRFWCHDLTVMTRQAVLDAISEPGAPFTVTELIARLPVTVPATEVDVLPILQEAVSEGRLFLLPGNKPKSKPRYSCQDLSAIAGNAVEAAITLAGAPFTAADLIAKLELDFKPTEADLQPHLQSAIDSGRLYSVSPVGSKGKPRFWAKDPIAETQVAVDAALAEPGNPFTIADLIGRLSLPVVPAEIDVQKFLDQAVQDQRLFTLAPAVAKGKPRYWNRDLTALTREAVREELGKITTPFTATELIDRLSLDVMPTESDVLPILDQVIQDGGLYRLPLEKPKAKQRYFHQDVTSIGQDAILRAIQEVDAPITAKDLVKRLQSDVKFAEADLIPILEGLVASKTLHRFEPSTEKGKPGYSNRDLAVMARESLLKTLATKGPQPEVNLRKLAKGLSDSQFQDMLQAAVGRADIFRHPRLPTGKTDLYGIRPPVLEPYLKDLGKQLSKVVATLTDSGVPRDDLRRALIQMLESTGIAFGSGLSNRQIDEDVEAAPSAAPSDSQGTAKTVDLITLMKRIEPGAERGALVGARELRRFAQLDKATFDSAVLGLAAQGKLSLHHHDFAASLSQQERDELVTDGFGTYYIGMALRQD